MTDESFAAWLQDNPAPDLQELVRRRACLEHGGYSIEDEPHGMQQRYVARWWRAPRAESENLYDGLSLDAAKKACERHAGRKRKAGRLSTAWV
jgi:hypothetical protein